jgi:DNA-binding NarL/FixJ family response regulator
LEFGLAHLLSTQPAVQVVGTAAPTRESMQQIATVGPDVVLVDYVTARRGDTVRLISATSAKSHVIAFAVREEEAEVLACAEAALPATLPVTHRLPSSQRSCAARVPASLHARHGWLRSCSAASPRSRTSAVVSNCRC